MFRKWFNRAAEIERLQGQVKHLQGELEIANLSRKGWEELTFKGFDLINKLEKIIEKSHGCEFPESYNNAIKKLRGLL